MPTYWAEDTTAVDLGRRPQLARRPGEVQIPGLERVANDNEEPRWRVDRGVDARVLHGAIRLNCCGGPGREFRITMRDVRFTVRERRRTARIESTQKASNRSSIATAMYSGEGAFARLDRLTHRGR